MKIVVTNLPAFYKINLFNEINKEEKLFVVFVDKMEYGRNSDFINGLMNFEYIFLKGNSFTKALSCFRVLKKMQYRELILGSWDYPVLWLLAFICKRSNNSLILESSYHESAISGWKGFFKRLFLKRVKKVYAPGKSNAKLARLLGYNGNIVITKGVGIFNYIIQPKYEEKDSVRNFIFVGRLVEEKNLPFLISVFNELPHLELFIVGFGILEKELKSISCDNIHFLGAINNKDLYAIYQKMDVFILPSKSETWGVVVEEALNNGLPVIVSDRVGCAEEIVDYNNGIVFESGNQLSMIDSINRIQNVDYYNKLRFNISKYNFSIIEKRQVQCYL